MSMPSTESLPAKSRRRAVAKAPDRPGPSKIKTAVHLSAESFRRLGVFAVMESKTQSEVVEMLIQEGLKRYRVQTIDRADPASSDDRATGEISTA